MRLILWLAVTLLGLMICFLATPEMKQADGNAQSTLTVSEMLFLLGSFLATLGTLGVYRGIFKRKQKLPIVRPTTPINVQKTNYSPSLQTIAGIRLLTPVEFERFIKRLFEKMDYEVETTRVTGDEGVDLRLQKGARRAIVQCKRYSDSSSVGQPAIRDLYGTMIHEQADEAYLITTGYFTLPAQAWAQGKPIHLVDRIQLLEWIRELNSSISA